MDKKQGDSPPVPPEPVGNHSKVFRHAEGGGWPGIELEPYKSTTELWKGITRRELIGKRGESPDFHVRYFEIEAGGFSTLEKHHHEHVVIPIRGKGDVQFGCYVHHVGFGDVIYIAPDDPHQFRTPEDATEPFGFICIVNARRDTPVSVDGLGACHICE
jgi:quercetin dioxygenase-like cupin family protein